jgi:hypothetical protein
MATKRPERKGYQGSAPLARAGIKRPAKAPVSPVERILRSDPICPPPPPLP